MGLSRAPAGSPHGPSSEWGGGTGVGNSPLVFRRIGRNVGSRAAPIRDKAPQGCTEGPRHVSLPVRRSESTAEHFIFFSPFWENFPTRRLDESGHFLMRFESGETSATDQKSLAGGKRASPPLLPCLYPVPGTSPFPVCCRHGLRSCPPVPCGAGDRRTCPPSLPAGCYFPP